MHRTSSQTVPLTVMSVIGLELFQIILGQTPWGAQSQAQVQCTWKKKSSTTTEFSVYRQQGCRSMKIILIGFAGMGYIPTSSSAFRAWARITWFDMNGDNLPQSPSNPCFGFSNRYMGAC